MPSGWPLVGLRFDQSANITEYLARIQRAQASTPDLYQVYTPETMPERYHFSPKNNKRISPIYLVPNIGCALTNHREFDVEFKGILQPKGVRFIALTLFALVILTNSLESWIRQ